MSTLFHITIRSAADEVVEFESERPVVHLELPEGRFRVTVRCVKDEPPGPDESPGPAPAASGTVH